MRAWWLCVAVLGCGSGTSGQGASHAARPAATKTTDARGAVSVTLSAEAEARLGVHTTPVAVRSLPRVRLVAGELRVAPERAVAITAPLAGTVRPQGAALPVPGRHVTRGEVLFKLVPVAPVDRDLRAQAERQVAVASARLTLATTQAERSRQLADDRAGSVRAAEEAEAARAVANAELVAARQRLRQVSSSPLAADVAVSVRAPVTGVVREVSVADGQPVPAGAPLVAVAALDALRVRANVYAGDLATLDLTATARVRSLGDRGEGVEATVAGVPATGDVNSASVDLWYDLANADNVFVPGERVEVFLQRRERAGLPCVPWSSVVHDVHGAAWVYRADGAHGYAKLPVEVAYVHDGVAALARGPAAGTSVVDTGAVEIYGVEAGAGH